MTRLYKIAASVFIVAVCCSNLLLQCSAQSTTVRPYKFGFTIDEQQHRSEQRDEKGIVMGEFGFITADGIYHVTVYATDEQGRFRILAMKSYPYESPPKTVNIDVKPKASPTTTTEKPKQDLARHNFYNEACSGCFLTNGNKEPAGSGETPKTGIRTLSKELPSSGTNSGSKAIVPKTNAGKPNTAGTTTKTAKAATMEKDIMDLIVNKVLPAAMGSKGVVVKPSSVPSGKAPSKPQIPIGSPGKTPSKASTPTGGSGGNSLAGGKGVNANFNPKTSNAASGSGSVVVGGGDGDLYHFKYILDYHGHEETGKRNGNKEGNYFAIGDDDVERTIEYVANENGYQPRINWRKRTEKDNLPKENTLKEYEFIWFYDK
ncbi:lethal (3) malignant blood neoplasm [Musca autumnalis]|uniref:lethal (3) malignant blood neoplasm n=1 Tax=Musca autumnalis TaxID=221902 RepID=UPI003CF45BCF